MKSLSFEQMEEVNGGSAYCDLIYYWANGGSGYQGTQEMLNYAVSICNYEEMADN